MIILCIGMWSQNFLYFEVKLLHCRNKNSEIFVWKNISDVHKLCQKKILKNSSLLPRSQILNSKTRLNVALPEINFDISAVLQCSNLNGL